MIGFVPSTGSPALRDAPLRNASLPEAMWRFSDNAFRFRGRASRSEYWWWMLVNVAVLGVTQILIPVLLTGRSPQPTLLVGPFGSALLANVEVFSWYPDEPSASPSPALSIVVAAVWSLGTLIPGLSVAIRRLHDSNLTAWWALLAFVPVGSVVLLLLATRRSRLAGVRFDG